MMTLDEAKRIIDVLSEDKYRLKGISLIRLSMTTDIPLSALRTILSKNHDYFLRVGTTQSYRINYFSEHKGDSATMLAQIESAILAQQRNESLDIWYYLSCLLSFLPLIVATWFELSD